MQRLDAPPSYFQFTFAAVLCFTAVATFIRYPGLAGFELWIFVGLFVLTAFLVLKNLAAWRDRREKRRSSALVIDPDQISLWGGKTLVAGIKPTDIDALKMRRFRKTLYLEIRDAHRRVIDVRLRAEPWTIQILKSRFQAMLSDKA